MSWRAELWQQLLQLRNRITRYGRSQDGYWPGHWPGLFIVVLLLAVAAGVIFFFSRPTNKASAQTPNSAWLAQMATRTPTRRAPATVTAITTSPVATATATKTATATMTPRPSTPTWTPFPTATQIAASPLLSASATPTGVVPLPADLTGPQVAPVGVIAASQALSGTATPTPTLDPLSLLVPTATPTKTLEPTRTITEALEQPVADGGVPENSQDSTQENRAGGLAGIVATATAAVPPVTEVEESTGDVPVDVPLPTPTAASQPTPDGTVRTARVPILMYHYLSVPPANADRIRIDLSVTPDLFAAHLDAIQQAGYTTISLYTLLDHLTHGAPLPEKPVVLTFDDGYRDHYTNAFPMLRERGLTATFFIVTDFLNEQYPDYLTWDMVREMYAGGMSIEGHGRNHVSLANKDREYLIWQALGTYESIEHEIGVRPRFISYPAGDYDQLTIEIFRSANYWAGFTTQQGATHRSDDLFQLRRVRVRGSTSPEELLRLLALDW